ncbi:MAG TPA: UDP-N-acetylmuramate dehydrogenase [Acidimicrobiales bacterium]
MTAGPEAVERAAALLGERARRDVALGPFTTYKVGGPAALLVQAVSAGDLAAVAGAVAGSGLDVLVIGKGSNLLVAEAGFGGIAVVLGDGFATVDIDGTRVRAGGAAALPVVARQTVRAGLTGFEWAVGVPGSIGGAVRMNAGGHGSDVAATLIEAEIADLGAGGAARVVPAADLALGYRRSAVGPAQVVVGATVGLAEGDREAGERTLSEIVGWRRANQPGGQNAGSVFTNPPGDSAGRLIDVSGCKGLRRGTASVSTKHANFFQADPGGSADDVWALMGEVRRRVAEATGVDLVPETRLVGFESNSQSRVEG